MKLYLHYPNNSISSHLTIRIINYFFTLIGSSIDIHTIIDGIMRNVDAGEPCNSRIFAKWLFTSGEYSSTFGDGMSLFSTAMMIGLGIFITFKKYMPGTRLTLS